MILSHIVAASENGAIGAQGDLLWRLPKDMKWFKEKTLNHCVLMGRKTYESFPPKFRPLPDRVNIVVTRDQSYFQEGAVIVHSIEEGIEYAREQGEKELFICGGGNIYAQTFDLIDRLYYTQVNTILEGDTFYPSLNHSEWNEVYRENHRSDERHAYDFSFLILER